MATGWRIDRDKIRKTVASEKERGQGKMEGKREKIMELGKGRIGQRGG